jgi:hypothetical protein
MYRHHQNESGFLKIAKVLVSNEFVGSFTM